MSKIEITDSLYDIAKNNILTLTNKNVIYFFAASEKADVENIRKDLTKDNGFLDVVVDLSDYNRLQSMIDSIPESDREFSEGRISKTYLLYKIMKSANLNQEYSLEEIEENLFSGDVDALFETYAPLYFGDIRDELAKKAVDTTAKGEARVHLFLDEVNSESLQRNINGIYTSSNQIAVLGYITKELLTLNVDDHTILERLHDYDAYESAKRTQAKVKINELQ